MSLCYRNIVVWPLPPHALTKFFEKLYKSSYSLKGNQEIYS